MYIFLPPLLYILSPPLTFTNDLTNDEVEVLFPNTIMNKSEQAASGKDEITQNISFTALYGNVLLADNTTTLKTDILITVKNDEAKYFN